MIDSPLDDLKSTQIKGDAPSQIQQLIELAKKYSKDECIIVNLSGRGDKDIETILKLGDDWNGKIWNIKRFSKI